MAVPKVVSGLGLIATGAAVAAFALSPLPAHTSSNGGIDLALPEQPTTPSTTVPPVDGPATTDAPSSSAPPSSTPDGEPRIVPESIPPRGELIQPADAALPEPPTAPFESLAQVAGGPVRWDPCSPVRFVVRRQSGPPNGFEIVIEGLQRLADASGLSFQFEGFTNEVPRDLNGERVDDDADVWIGWAFDDEIPELGPATEGAHIVGVASPMWFTNSPQIVSGTVVLRADSELDHDFGPGESYGNVMLHELGHLVGLGHSSSTSDLMFPTTSPSAPDGWGPGDLAGLYDLGSSQPCF